MQCTYSLSQPRVSSRGFPLVGIVIVNYNGTDDTMECLGSLRQLTYPRYRIYLVDNGSTPSPEPLVAQRYPEVVILRLPTNRGFAPGSNAGIREALRDGADYVWLLNNDTVVDPAALSELVRGVESDRRYGVAGSMILRYREPQIIDHAGGRIVPWWGLGTHLGAGQQANGSHGDVRIVDYVTGASLLAKRAVIEAAGLLSEDYFLYYEDTEWCVKVRALGWKVVYVPTSRIYHKVGHSVQSVPTQATYYFARNSLLFVRRNYPWWLPLAVLWWPRRFLLNHMLKRRWKNVMAGLRGLRDAIPLLLRPAPSRPVASGQD